MTSADRHAASLWWDQVGPRVERPALDGDRDVDVAIIGAGYTGLWTAHTLLGADPSLRVLLLERAHVGFGASGRNGGWCVGELAGGVHAVRPDDGPGRRQVAAIVDTVAEVERVVVADGIDCDWRRGGVVRVARTAPQLARQHAEVAHARALGLGDDVIAALDRDAASARLAASDVRGGIWYGPGARVQPARLAVGLAAAVERRGAQIAERTSVLAIEPAGARPARAVTDRGVVTAAVVVHAVEGYARDLPGDRRRSLPLYSLMIATEPLPDDLWAEIGLADAETFADDRRLVIYGQRTADGRLAFGGRGARYGFGSRIDPRIERHSTTHDRIESTLRSLLPQLGGDDGVTVTHRWGGVLGVPRSWRPGVGFDRAAGVAWAGGYVGEGVAASNLAGRTLAALVLGDDPGAHVDRDLATLPWVVERPGRRWEPEPLRWAGVNAGLALAGVADERERRRDRPSRLGRVVDRLLG